MTAQTLFDPEPPTLWHAVGHRAVHGRNLTAAQCRTCKAFVVLGLDDDICAFDAIADPQPITRIGEAIAVLTGRRTYELDRAASGWQLHKRDVARAIVTREAGRILDVLAEHRCGTPPLSAADPIHPALQPPLPPNSRPDF